ncbi:MAG TPA: SH3 domain-containing protein [Polyangia bacterium]|nr:SH3 domain-containing protein [Polyangia bacterium]
MRVACLAAVAFGGCASTNPVMYMQINPPPRPMVPRPFEQVDMFLVTPPSRPHVDVAMLQAFGWPGASDPIQLQMMLGQLLEGAAQRGCDAVLVTMIDARYGRYSTSSVQGSCELYTDARAEQKSPAPAAPSRPPVVVTIASSGADIRDAPRSEAQVVVHLDAGVRLIVNRSEGGWSTIKLSTGRLGYISDVAIFQDP